MTGRRQRFWFCQFNRPVSISTRRDKFRRCIFRDTRGNCSLRTNAYVMERHPRLLTDTHTHTHTHLYTQRCRSHYIETFKFVFSRFIHLLVVRIDIFSLYLARWSNGKVEIVGDFFLSNRHCRSFFIFDRHSIVNENNLESRVRKRRIIRSFPSFALTIHVCEERSEEEEEEEGDNLQLG